ncbi:hypothetical protein CI111_03350 [Fusobacterium animalis]|uniref:Riboflavin synthase subunit alpha n=1 Tax=Fusobacterium animalis TaxID=76859 RepID=A0A2B7YTK2_9FUSO|nr:hypothetical protein CBG60_00930 [Fusobacterium animalis]PGH24359.1 hypothetical protein RN90_02290 [Fusobacterium animalis]PIM91552.1 hypothetical protein CI114_05080 [Fusobacterium animalis]PIM94167.1 hypothetical protein CI111_03350 [Fusobacterium animalis]
MNEVSLVNLQRILDFLSLRNLASNELFFILFISSQQPLLFHISNFILPIPISSTKFSKNSLLSFTPLFIV